MDYLLSVILNFSLAYVLVLLNGFSRFLKEHHCNGVSYHSLYLNQFNSIQNNQIYIGLNSSQEYSKACVNNVIFFIINKLKGKKEEEERNNTLEQKKYEQKTNPILLKAELL